MQLRHGIAAILLVLVGFSWAEPQSPRPASLSDLVSVERAKPEPIWAPGEFSAGTSISFSIEGEVVPYRKFDYVEECTTWVIWCLSHQNVLKIVAEQRFRSSDFPLLVQFIDSAGTLIANDRLVPIATTDTKFSSTTTSHVQLREQTKVTIRIAPGDTAADIGRQFRIVGFLPDLFPGGVTKRNQCLGATVGECAAGQYVVRITGVDSAERSAFVTALLGRERIANSQLAALVDFWLVNEVREGSIQRRSQGQLVALSKSLVTQHRKFHKLTSDGEPFLALALELDQANTDAQADLVEEWIKLGKHVQADKLLKERLPDIRSAYENAAAQSRDAVIDASPFYNYASTLTSQADVMRNRSAQVDGNDIRVAATYYSDASAALRNLQSRRPSLVQWRDLDPVVVRALYLRALRGHADTSQLLRSQGALDSAISSLRAARQFAPRSESGTFLGLSSDGRQASILDTQLTVPIKDSQGRTQVGTLQTMLLPPWVLRVVGRSDGVFLLQGRDGIYLWSLEPGAGKVLRLADLNAKQMAVKGWTSASRRLYLIGDGTSRPYALARGEVSLEFSKGETLVDMSSDGTIARISDKGHVEILAAGSATPTLSDPLPFSPERIVIDKDGSSVIAFNSSRVIRFDRNSATQVTMSDVVVLAKHSLSWAASRLDISPFARFENRHVVVFDNETCLVSPIAVESCASHGVAALSKRIVAPGILRLGEREFAVVLRPALVSGDPQLVRFLISDAAEITVDVTNLPRGLTAGLDSTVFHAEPRGDGGFVLTAAVPALNGSVRAVDLATLSTNSNLPTGRINEGTILAPNGSRFLLEDNKSGALFDFGSKSKHGRIQRDSAELSNRDLFVDINRDANNGDAVELRNALTGSGVKSIVLPDYETLRFEILTIPTRDHSRAQSVLALGGFPRDGDTQRLQKIGLIDSDTGTIDLVQTDVDAANLLAIWRSNKGDVVYLTRELQKLVVHATDGKVLHEEVLPALGSEGSMLIVQSFAASAGAYVRAFDRSNLKGIVVRIWEGPEKIESALIEFDAANLLQNYALPVVKRDRALQPILGFIDAEDGILAVPRGSCYLVGAIGSINGNGSATAWLPSSTPLTPSIVLFKDKALLVNGTGMQIQRGSSQRSPKDQLVPQVCPENMLAF